MARRLGRISSIANRVFQRLSRRLQFCGPVQPWQNFSCYDLKVGESLGPIDEQVESNVVSAEIAEGRESGEQSFWSGSISEIDLVDVV